MYIYIYIYIYMLSWPWKRWRFFVSPNKRSFRALGCVVRGLDLGRWAKICARELASGLQWPPGASHHQASPFTTTYYHPPSPTTNDKYDIEVSSTTLGPKFKCQSVLTMKPPFQTHTQIFLPGYRNLLDLFHLLRGSRAPK